MLPEHQVTRVLQIDRRRGERPPTRFKRAPRRRQSALARYGAAPRQDRSDAAELVAEMQARGAEFYIWNDAERRDFRFAHRLRDGADVERCRAIVAQVRADPELQALFRVEVFVAIAREAWGLPARRR